MVPDASSQVLVLAVVALIGMTLLGAVLRRLGRVFRRRTGERSPLAAGLQALGVVLVLLAGSLYLDRAGTVVPGEVVGRDEQIQISNGSWGRRLALAVRFRTEAGEQRTEVIGVSEAIFDRTPQGATVRVRYLPPVPVLARLEEQSTVALALSILPWSPTRFAALGVAGLVLLGFVAMRGAWRPWRWLPIPLLALWGIVLAQLIASVLPHTLLSGSRRETTAEVIGITRVTESWLSTNRMQIPVAQPYDLVELALEAPGRASRLIAVDAIDTGSAAHLVPGARVPVVYGENAPREARLVSAKRGHVWTNWLELAMPMAPLLVSGIIWLFLRDASPLGRKGTRRWVARQQDQLLDMLDAGHGRRHR